MEQAELFTCGIGCSWENINLGDVHAAGNGGLEAVEADRAGVAVKQRPQLLLAADALLRGAPQRGDALLHAQHLRHHVPAAVPFRPSEQSRAGNLDSVLA